MKKSAGRCIPGILLIFLLLIGFKSEIIGTEKKSNVSAGTKNSLIFDTINWIQANSGRFAVNGLWWFGENSGSFNRLPLRAKTISGINPKAIYYSEYPSGGRIRFKTDSPFISLRIDHGGDPFSWKELSIMAMAGIELYEGDPENMVFRSISRPESGLKPYIINFNFISGGMKEYTLYLPAYAKLKTLEIGVMRGSVIEPSTPYSISRPVVFYGSSFIQGGCASRASMNLPALIGRELGIDIINLGFAGDGTYESEMAKLLAEIDAVCFIIGPVLNDTILFNDNYARFVSHLRQQRPTCPIMLMTRLQTTGQKDPFPVNKMVHELFIKMKRSGDEKIFYFDSFFLYKDGSIHPTAEGTHPTDLGFKIITDALAPELSKIINLSVRKF